jgi:hypothetical protein
MNSKPGLIGQLLGVLYKPKEIFNTIDEKDLTKGVAIAIIMSVLATFSTFTYMNKIPLDVLTPQLRGVEANQIEGSISLISGVTAGVSRLVGWIIIGFVIHFLGRFLGGEGSLNRYFALYGFSTVPALLNQMLRVVDASIMDSVSLINYYISYRDMSNKIVKAFIGANLLNIWTLAGIALIILSLEENYKVSRGRALLISLIPSILSFVIAYFSI